MSTTGLLKAAPDRGFHIVPTEGSNLSKNTWNLNTVMKQQTQFSLCGISIVIGNQPKQVCRKRKIWQITPHNIGTLKLHLSYLT